MVVTLENIVPTIMPYLEGILGIAWMVAQVLFWLSLFAYLAFVWKYDTKVNIREFSKGGRLIVRTTRALRFRDKKTGAPQLRFFNLLLWFGGDIIHEPPAECLIAYKSRVTNKMYDFIKKDGLYFPVNNLVLGTRKDYVDEKTGERKYTHSLEGSGLETSRDYDSEQAIQNTLIDKATAYRNRKPTEIIASYALMIIVAVGSFFMMWYAWKQFGNIAMAIEGLRQPLKEGIVGAAQSIIGPG